MSRLIIHAYDASPFTQRVLRMLGFKNLEWDWIETPMMPPKDDLTALTGGYRGTPIMQVGRDVYIDSQLIARELERRHPHPSLHQDGNPGMSLALDRWSAAFFRTGLKIILAMTAKSWPEAFRKDRELLFPDLEFPAMGAQLGDARAQYRAHASLLESQLSDGRKFLGGAHAGLMDANAHPFVWFMRGALPAVAGELLADMPRLAAWETRVVGCGEGRRHTVTPATAADELRSAPPLAAALVDPHDAQGLKSGMQVRITPEETRRGDVEGRLHIAQPNEIAVVHQRAGSSVLVHFPRLGYRVSVLSVGP